MPITAIEFQSTLALKQYLVASALAIALFAIVLLSVLTLPVMTQWDQALSSATQGLRSPTADPLAVAFTMLGDLRLAHILFAAVLAGLAYRRRWWLIAHLTSVGLSAMLSVSIIKSLLARPRPETPYIVLDSFSFPSGHACTAAVAWGLIALILAQGRRRSQRYWIYAAGALIVAGVAFSRVYLQVHWPSDVIAGAALGYGLLMTFAWQLHNAPLQRTPSLFILLSIVCAISAAYLLAGYAEQAVRYHVTSETLAPQPPW